MQIQTVDYRSENAPRSLAQSLRETGFAVLTNHPITAARIEAIYASWGAFFASEEKHNYCAIRCARMAFSRLSPNMPKMQRKRI